MARILPFDKDRRAGEHAAPKDISEAVGRQDPPALCTALEASPGGADALDFLGNSPLHYAAEKGNPEIVSILIEHGAKIDRFNCEGKTPLMLAAERNRFEAAIVLVENGADVTLRSTGSGSVGKMFFSYEPMTARQYAEEKGHDALAQYLCRHEGN